MKTEFAKEFFIENRRKLQTLFTGTAPIVITANGLLQRNSDTTFPFRQDSNFWYLTGIEDPDVILVIDKRKEYLIIPDRNEQRKAFDGALDTKKLSNISGIEEIFDEKTGKRVLSARLKKVKHVATLAAPVSFEDNLGIYTNPARARLIEQIKQENPKVELLDIRSHLTRMRMIKQSEEIKAIKKAIKITERAFLKARRKVRTAKNERDVQLVFDKYFASNFVSHAYQPITAAGINACTLHHVDNNSEITPGDLVLIDAGAEFRNYSSDITRTYSTKSPTKRQRDVHAAVLEVHNFALSTLSVGISIRDNEQKIEHFMGEKLRELGLIKAINHENVRKYYPHATSHHLGLDTHDVADYERPLEDGMVLTVEPGIYIPEESLGIRIEDDVLIKDGKVEVLSKNLPKDLE